MKSVIANIKQVSGLSSYTNFANAIKGRNFSKLTIRRGFNKFVKVDDYDKKEKQEILDFLYTLSKPSLLKK